MLVAVRRHDTLERHIHLADPGIRIQRAIGRFETHCPAKGHPEDIAAPPVRFPALPHVSRRHPHPLWVVP